MLTSHYLLLQIFYWAMYLFFKANGFVTCSSIHYVFSPLEKMVLCNQVYLLSSGPPPPTMLFESYLCSKKFFFHGNKLGSQNPFQPDQPSHGLLSAILVLSYACVARGGSAVTFCFLKQELCVGPNYIYPYWMAAVQCSSPFLSPLLRSHCHKTPVQKWSCW
jgi:hypothetical protein